ncbi:AAA family ATPase [Mycoplasma putrefaciens]|uniref:RecD/TraA family helicase n=1 Tax=Mycoplasma putrefaciens (strain ATCC 15718 / NCTC 10155 / C30 KS-1 / KS-1) TaxID=743965 RepID=A0A7U4E9S3_MYCPK|nr:AAA family ATPase [Mycoplasma putrefaciens]AEM68834.1 RecD/TraA family helicase [Mycoplasma putrefaciens KS1]
MEKIITIRGYIIKFLYLSDNWALAIFASEDNAKKTIKIKGPISLMKPKVLYELNGFVITHPKYGSSFEVSSFVLANIDTQQQIINFLKSDVFPGIGNLTAKKIAEHYSSDFIKEILEDREKFFSIKGINKFKLEHIYQIIYDIEQNNSLTSEFINHQLNLKILKKLQQHITDQKKIVDILSNNFFDFAFKFNLGKIEDIDKIWLHFSKKPNDIARIAYWTLHACNQILFSTGDSYTDQKTLVKRLETLIDFDVSENKEILLNSLVFSKEHELLIFKDNRVYTNTSYYDEQHISEMLMYHQKNTLNNKSNLSDQQLDKFIREIEQKISVTSNIKDFKYDRSQIDALKAFATNNITIITGGPGTGKTTIIQAIVKLFQKIFKSSKFSVSAPTGRAAGKIRESFTGSEATTIHKLLQYDGDEDRFFINKENPLNFDLLIVDECSMIDNRLFSQFLLSSINAKKIVLVGDPDQLPSVSYGNAFADIIKSNKIKAINLNQIHRQSKNNGIIQLAYMIKNDNFDLNKINDFNNVEFIFDQNKDYCLEQIKKYYQKDLNFINPYSIQIICPMYAGTFGIDNLNDFIQSTFNLNSFNEQKVYQRLKTKYVVNDKIMYLKNDSKLNISNGDVGIIKAINKKQNKFLSAIVNFNNIELEFTNQNFEDLTLSYACSVHKTQGSEYDTVILVLDSNHFNQFIDKKLLYTAVTRAKKHLIIIAKQEFFLSGIKKQAKPRNTTLQETIIQMFDN